MKKLNFIILFITLTSTVALAQGTLGKGGKQLNAGVGFSSWGVPIYAGLDFGVHESITIGPKVSYRNYNYRSSFYNYSQSLFVLSFNGNYHFNKVLNLPSEWDLYAGLSVGYYLWSDAKVSSGGTIITGTNASTLGLDAQIGVRYFFTKNFGLNLEFGGGTGTGGNFGITYKF